MSRFTPRRELIAQPPAPVTDVDRQLLCGLVPEAVREEYWQKHGDNHASFFVAGDREPPRKVQLWRIFREVLGFDPDLTPQPTGNCVAAAADDVIELIQAIEIGLGQAEEFHPIYNPYHYATGRVFVGGNRLKGGAGSLGGWQAKAIEQFGVIRLDQDGLPEYNQKNCDRWGDDRDADGQSFRDYVEQGKEHPIKATARVKTIEQVIQSLANLYPLTIAASFGYRMKADSPTGTMRQGESWGHQMSVWGYDLDEGTVEIKNQWGDVHGSLIDPGDNEELPRGFIRTGMETFEKHLRNSETISYSNFDGFPEQQFDFGGWA